MCKSSVSYPLLDVAYFTNAEIRQTFLIDEINDQAGDLVVGFVVGFWS